MFKRQIKHAYPNEEGLPHSFRYPTSPSISRKERKKLSRLIKHLRRQRCSG